MKIDWSKCVNQCISSLICETYEELVLCPLDGIFSLIKGKSDEQPPRNVEQHLGQEIVWITPVPLKLPCEKGRSLV